MNILAIKKILIIFFSVLSIGAVQANETIIKIGLPLISPPWNTSQFLQQSIHYLSWKLPQYKFEAVWVSVDDIEKSFEEGKLNLAVFPSLPTLFGNSKTRRVLSTIVDTRAPNPDSGTSCVILVSKDSPIKDLKDIRGKHIISTNKMSLPGNLACLAEIEKSGINTDDLNLRLLGDLNEKFLIDDLKQHKADAAFVRSGFIEDVLLASGKNILEGLRVLNPQQNKQLLSLIHSTGTYPGPTLVANNNISPQAVHAILSTLLTIPPNSYGQKWTIPANSESVDELARNLKIGPYAYLRSWTVERIWEEYKFFVTLAVLFIIFLFIHSWLTQKEVVKKTAHLSQALKDQKAAEEMAAAKGKRIEFLEKKAVIGQLSNIVAHEVNGPIGIIQNLTHGLRKQIDVTLDSEADPADTLDSIENQLNIIEKEADKVCSIIAKMRLANKTGTPGTDSDLSEILQTVGSQFNKKCQVILKGIKETTTVGFNPIELEVVIYNLFKNAYEASAQEKNPRIFAEVSHKNDTAILRVWDSGPALSEKEFLNIVSEERETTKAEGIGMGLSIVSALVRKHEGKLVFSRSELGGLEITLVLPLSITAHGGKE